MAFGISDLTNLLDRWSVWKEVRSNADKVPALENRIAELEAKLERAPGEACPKCGAYEFRTERTEPYRGSIGRLGAIERTLMCRECGYSESKVETPK